MKFSCEKVRKRSFWMKISLNFALLLYHIQKLQTEKSKLSSLFWDHSPKLWNYFSRTPCSSRNPEIMSKIVQGCSNFRMQATVAFDNKISSITTTLNVSSTFTISIDFSYYYYYYILLSFNAAFFRPFLEMEKNMHFIQV